MDCSVLKRLMNREESGGGAGGGGSHGALGLLSGGKCLLLDCRPFLAHSAGYIRGSVNVRCNTIVRRRAKGSVSLEQILPAEEEVRARLRSGLYSAVIVYDERSPRAESLREDSTVSLVVRALRRNAERTDICLLKGKLGRRRASGRLGAAGLGGPRRGGRGRSARGDPRPGASPRTPLCAPGRVGLPAFCASVCERERLRSSETERVRLPCHLPARTLGALCVCVHPQPAGLRPGDPTAMPSCGPGGAPKCRCAGGDGPGLLVRGARAPAPKRRKGARPADLVPSSPRLVPRCPAPSSAWKVAGFGRLGLDPSSGGGAGRGG